MIKYLTGNILESDAKALVNTVNLVGVMGKGIALQFKKSFPKNYKEYKKACEEKRIGIGKLFVSKENLIDGEKIIINFPTKTDWRKPSEYSYIEAGLDDLKRVIKEHAIDSVAIPPLGAGNGGLIWSRVKKIIEDKLYDLSVNIYVYEPNKNIQEKLKKERARLTDGRALLLYVLFDLVSHGEFVSEFSSEKVCYFLQKFGGKDIFKLKFEPKYYGPYSGKVRYVLNRLNGSYIMGYDGMDKKPFEILSLVPDSYEEIKERIDGDEKLREIAQKTTRFLDGFYSDFGLELLSSVDYILTKNGDLTEEKIYEKLSEWNYSKSKKFNDRKTIKIAREHILNA